MPEYFKRDPAGVPQEITNLIAKRIMSNMEQHDGHATFRNLRQLGAADSGAPAGGSGDTGGQVSVLSADYLAAFAREYQDDDPPPPHVIRAMSKIAIYAATYSPSFSAIGAEKEGTGGKDETGAFLRDTTIAEPLGIVRTWLKEYGFDF